jgi:hypothetical protein
MDILWRSYGFEAAGILAGGIEIPIGTDASGKQQEICSSKSPTIDSPQKVGAGSKNGLFL